jgi:hypothetical protein
MLRSRHYATNCSNNKRVIESIPSSPASTFHGNRLHLESTSNYSKRIIHTRSLGVRFTIHDRIATSPGPQRVRFVPHTCVCVCPPPFRGQNQFKIGGKIAILGIPLGVFRWTLGEKCPQNRTYYHKNNKNSTLFSKKRKYGDKNRSVHFRRPLKGGGQV